jgi:hypothetical protein
MRKVSKYKILARVDEDDLAKSVEAGLKKNWELYGAPFSFNEGLAQAMVKYAKDDLDQPIPSTLMPPQEAPLPSNL